jgi:hypothetical protein
MANYPFILDRIVDRKHAVAYRSIVYTHVDWFQISTGL